jgi:hypothetical protein
MNRAHPLRLLLLLVVCWFVNGTGGLVIGAVLAAGLLLGARSKALLDAGAVTMLLAAIHAIALGLPSTTTMSSTFVLERLLTHHLVFGGVALLVVGVLVDDMPRRLQQVQSDTASARGER